VESRILREKSWSYTLSQLPDQSVVLSVLCGTVGMYMLHLPLDAETAATVMGNDKLLEKMADQIREHPDQYAERSFTM
jgi:hypothetical protein